MVEKRQDEYNIFFFIRKQDTKTRKPEKETGNHDQYKIHYLKPHLKN